jgi:large subunit ribosomal protein L10e
MVRKPAKMYRNISKRAYTRREYMGGVPGSKIVQFEMGNLAQEFPTQVDLLVDEACQIRHSALEAARISINRRLMKDVGRANFHFKVRVYPHHVLRENKQATGAGADRVSEGMRLAFGKAVGTAARVDPDQRIFSIFSTPQYLEKVKDALHHGGHKLPSPSHLKISTIKVSGKIVAPKFAEDKMAKIAAEAAPVEVAEEPKEAEAAAAKGGKEAGKGAAPVKGGKEAGKGAAPAKGEEKKGAAPAKGDEKKGAEPAKGAKGKK